LNYSDVLVCIAKYALFKGFMFLFFNFIFKELSLKNPITTFKRGTISRTQVVLIYQVNPP
jgi:hypothetical protein